MHRDSSAVSLSVLSGADSAVKLPVHIEDSGENELVWFTFSLKRIRASFPVDVYTQPAPYNS